MTTMYEDPQLTQNPGAGLAVSASWGDQVRDDLEFLIAPPMVKAQRTSDYTTVTTGAWTAVPFNVADAWDTDAFHDTTTNNTRITIPSGFGGRYLISACMGWDSNTSGTVRQISIRFNGSTHIATVLAGPATYVRHYVAVEYDLAATQYVEVVASQDSGADRTILVDSVSPCWFSARWISR